MGKETKLTIEKMLERSPYWRSTDKSWYESQMKLDEKATIANCTKRELSEDSFYQ